MGWGTRAGATVGVVLVLVGGYLVADAADVVPGMLTTQPPPQQPAPFPTAAGAVAPPPLADALPTLADDAPEPAAATVQAQVDALVKDDRLGSRVGVFVTDAVTGETLGAAGQDSGLVPASTQKLLTAAAALSGPGPDATLPTTVVRDGLDSLYLVGGGDMMLAAGSGDPKAVDGRAGLADLADQVADELQLAGRTTVSLRLDDTIFTGDAVSPAVFPGNVTAGYIAPVAALAVDVARLDDAEYARRADDPGMAAAKTFVAALADRGVTVTGDVSRAQAPPDADPVGEVRSAPLREVVDYFLQHSDNTITEVVGRVVAIDEGLPASPGGATKAVLGVVGDLGVDLDGAVLADCSGLGDGSRLTPRQLADVVALLVDPDHPELRSAAVGLPIAGLRGTLHDRFLDTAARGVARAKTGSLPNVTSLAGSVVTADDRLVVYTLMVDAVPDGGTYGARVILDDFVGGLAECGCSG